MVRIQKKNPLAKDENQQKSQTMHRYDALQVND